MLSFTGLPGQEVQRNPGRWGEGQGEWVHILASSGVLGVILTNTLVGRICLPS